MAIGIGAARSNDLSRAAEAGRNLTTLRDAMQPKSVYWSSQIEVQRHEVAAWSAQASGKSEEAIAGMRAPPQN